MDFLRFCIFVISTGLCFSRSQEEFARLEVILKRETDGMKRDLLEIKQFIEMMNTSERCTCAGQEYNFLTIDTAPVVNSSDDVEFGIKVTGEYLNEIFESGWKGDKKTVIMSFDDKEIVKQYVKENLEEFEKIIIGKIEHSKLKLDKELHHFADKMLEESVKNKNITFQEIHGLMQHVSKQDSIIAAHKIKIYELENQVKDISKFLLPSEDQLILTTLIPKRKCPEGWVLAGDICYMISRKKLDWFSAVNECRSFGGKLTEPATRDQVETVYNFTRGVRVWIGVTDRFHEDTYVWESTKERVHYLPWEPGQPNNFLIDQDCVEIIDTQPLFNDKPCFATDAFVCEK